MPSPAIAPAASESHPGAFHPAVERWFSARFGAPTSVQSAAWPAAQTGSHVLLAAPTGSGKTLAAFLTAIDALVREGSSGNGLPDETRVIYVSPLRALSNDVEKNLIEPLAGIRQALRDLALPDVEIRTAVRTGDTPAAMRSRARKQPPHIYVTTPESLYILLTSEGGRQLLKTVDTIIVDEIHALIGDKRGSHLALSIERLAALTGKPLQRIGVSATQKPIEQVAAFLTGGATAGACTVVNTGHARERDLGIEIPQAPLEAVMSGEVWEEVYARIVELVRSHRTTLLFVNTRRLCERLARRLADLLGEDKATSHHGSLSREHRLRAEQRLKAGELSVLVATASLELGIDIGDVDLVIQIGSTRSISAFLQRVGRSGHSLRATPKGRIFPLSRDELCEAAALLQAIQRGELDQLRIPVAPLDILAQQIVAATAAEGEWQEDALFALVRRAYPYRDLERAQFDSVLEMLAQGFASTRGRRGAHLHRDITQNMLRPRRGARLAAITSGGAIPDLADYEVVLEPEGTRVGSINEDFAIESMAGDIFQLGNQSYVIRRVEPGKVRVEDARGAPPTIPFWLGEAPARTEELSLAVGRLRREISELLDRAPETEREASVAAQLASCDGLNQAAAEQIVNYISIARTTLGAIPDKDSFIIERFFDETGGMHLVLHAPLGARINRAWGLTLRKCFCRKFDFELQAAANDDAIILSLGPTHSFELDEVWHYARSASARDVLIQALLVAPVFGTRWRWNTQRALAVLRFRGGNKVPARFQRMDADDLLTLCFPDQVACAENLAGEREVPDHPLVNQTVVDATTEALDVEGFLHTLRRLEAGEIQLVARDLTEPSPLAANILTAKPYAFLDDAPLEERRTQAVFSRRWLDAGQAKDLAALNPAAIALVKADAWPDPRTPDEMLDALEVLGFMTEDEGRAPAPAADGDKTEPQFEAMFQALCNTGRATALRIAQGSNALTLWVAATRLHEHLKLHPQATFSPAIHPALMPSLTPTANSGAPQAKGGTPDLSREHALRELIRSRLEALGPVTTAAVATSLAVSDSDALQALLALETEGVVFQGSYSDSTQKEWCERRLLARIHRATLDRLRAEIEPVTQQTFMRFLLHWQRVDASNQAGGQGGTQVVVDQLEGYEVPAPAWEADILRSRVDSYDPAWLDALCLSGRISWLRRTPTLAGPGNLKTTPIALVPRGKASFWRNLSPKSGVSIELSADAQRLEQCLRSQGPSFFDDLERGNGLLRSRAEEALAELAARGLTTSDSFSGLRSLLSLNARDSQRGRRRVSSSLGGLSASGRWSLLAGTRSAEEAVETPNIGDDDLEHIARVLLRRWGVVFRALLDREGPLPPWRDLLRCYRRLEARGEIRGGRFVSGFSGEQYALPDAVASLRSIRRKAPDGSSVVISAADPLNLVGMITPGRRISSLAGNRILLRDGVPCATREGGNFRSIVSEKAGDSPTPPREDIELLTRRFKLQGPAPLWLGRRVPQAANSS